MYKKLIAVAAAASTIGLASVAFALSSTDYSLFDSAHYISPGNASARAVQLVSDNTQADGGIDFGLGSAALTVADLTNLSTDYKFEAGSCGGGSPRFQVNVQTPNGVKNIFAYLGAAPNYTNCPQNVWTNSGNLVTPASLVDASQLGGTFYEPWSAVVASYGSYPITGIQLVADAGWAFPSGQIADIDNTSINSTTYTYEIPTATSKDQCKNGGWQNF
ncbi:MAG: hypothetical protein JO019_03420, partial [Candidatus Kaiserbacteria bacterium]|nr:hypothetical protein [Candidatus Kaiserbacteria bacterium]